MKIGISKKKISTSVLISMTDVIFLLLLFLLIASNFTDQTGLPFKLPGSVSQQKQTNQVMHIVYSSDSNIRFLDVVYTLDNLGSALKKEYRNKEQVVRLSADQATPLQNVISVMDIIRDAGYERIFVATESIQSKK